MFLWPDRCVLNIPGAFCHVIQRGNERKDIFISDQDRVKFYEYLTISVIAGVSALCRRVSNKRTKDKKLNQIILLR